MGIHLTIATENFDESLVIGQGGFGKVYIGNLMDGPRSVVAAIKRLDTMSRQGAAEFWAEVEILSKLRHCNLVSLIGYCNHGQELILVYEYMPNGTLEDHLHKICTPLSWTQRLRICIGASCGLHYLHTGTGIESGVIHRDVKSSNILLLESWTAKISDFGLSKTGPTNQPITYVNTLVKGTFGYLDPDYYATGKLTRKSDVYAFGVVMLELLCRKRAVDKSLDEEQWNLAKWGQESIKEGNLKHIVDYDIRAEISPKCLKKFVRIVLRCLHSNPKQRLTMAQVLARLENVLILQEKYDNSLRPADSTLLGRMVHMLPFFSDGENSAQGRSKISSDNKGNSERASNIIQKFDIDVLRKSTNDFSQYRIIGEGDFGTSYLGWVTENTFTPSEHEDGVIVAVKMLHFFQEHADWQEMVNFLGQLAHPNIVTLLGYCSDEFQQCLVFEYMHNESFDRFIFTDIPNHIAEPLSWRTRLMIMIGVASGLVYLRSINKKFVLPYLTSANILLDENFNAKLGDCSFSVTKYLALLDRDGKTRNISLQSIRKIDYGTYSYIDPTYLRTGYLSEKSDIYNFGVVLLETLTGLRVTDRKRPIGEQNLVDWARPILGKREELKKIMDPRLEQNYPIEGAFDWASLALRCAASYPKDRPSSEEVLKSLEQILSNSMTASEDYPIISP
uniref:serine/threonine-protein kinase PBL35-like n=1 Tax=Erigeron canadensis TaxID=72917 RepID=UPI001CB89335|nr:serine/threonine-protein kinase PBL35-like [Erigeron canadensis]